MKRTSSPPGIFLNFFRWFCHPDLVRSIEGDLQELYNERVKMSGVNKANLRFALDVFLLFRPGIIKPLRLIPSNSPIMYKSYFTLGWRNLIRNKTFSAINIFGLAIGLTACLFIFQFVSFELSFDSFNEKLNRTYRLTNDRFQNGKLIQHGTITYPALGAVMKKDYEEIETYTRMMPVGDINVRIEDKNFRDDIGYFVDGQFFTVFDFKILAGDKSTFLNEPYTAVLTESVARKYFDLTGADVSDAINKTFYWGLNTTPYVVKGVCEDAPANSHFQFDALISYASLITEEPDTDNSWTWSDMYYYIVLKPGADYKKLESKFPDFSERYFEGDKVTGSVEKFYLQPMKDAHLYSDYEYDFALTSNGKAVWAMLVVAVFILIIAWVNYVNLTTSRALDRAKEVGLRKVMGAFRSQVISQFVFESILVTGLALLLAVILMFTLQDSFNLIIGKSLSWRNLFDGVDTRQIVFIAGCLLAGALISGFYPAFILSSYSPVTILKGKFTRSSAGGFLHKTLVIFQFTASAVLITSTLIVSRQVQFMSDADLGLGLKNVVAIRAPELTQWDSTFITRVESYKSELLNVPGVVSASTSGRLPGDRLARYFGLRLADQPSDANYTVSHVEVDYNFFETYNVNLIAGRNFIFSDHHLDFYKINSVIINTSAASLLGITNPEDAIGKELVWGNNGTRKWTIIGVVADYHQEALQKPMEATVYRPLYQTWAPTSVKINAQDPKETVAGIEAVYKKFFPENSFEYFFIEDVYNNQYNEDTRFGKIMTVFTVLAIIVACLGLIGLSSYAAVLRTKEVGIRKVLGASVANVLYVLSGDFVKLILVASFISIPIAYFSMSRWLEGYAYHIQLSWIHFAVAILLVLMIAIITITVQVGKTARSNPAKTLKYE